ncbi:MAG: peptidoglycan editing factor PgeF [Holosporaceae bacterium]|nr:peptidoglycan editing factor PgeF [Holosporaceae bacterium]
MKIESSNLTSVRVAHGFFRRGFGCSGGLFSSLNGSRFVGDDDRNVRRNLDTVRDQLAAARLVTLKQVHGNQCLAAASETESDVEADALVTKEPGVAVGVLTADCAPILLADEKAGVVGAAHAGWRGALDGIIEATVLKMQLLGGDPREIRAAIGPCIDVESYDVDDDFQKNFTDSTDSADYFRRIGGGLRFDLAGYCRMRLLGCGLPEGNVNLIGVNTYGDPENYFSYRRARRESDGVCGRNISAICLKV